MQVKKCIPMNMASVVLYAASPTVEKDKGEVDFLQASGNEPVKVSVYKLQSTGGSSKWQRLSWATLEGPASNPANCPKEAGKRCMSFRYGDGHMVGDGACGNIARGEKYAVSLDRRDAFNPPTQ
jgi:hypothetical protein